jgi:hypothetical protein
VVALGFVVLVLGGFRVYGGADEMPGQDFARWGGDRDSEGVY